MLTKVFGSAVQGVNAYTITIEVVVSAGTNFYVVGLPDNAIKESQQRIEAALKLRGYRMPRTKVVVNMAPADIRKEGAAYDLPIALGILHASQQLTTEHLADYIIMGELSLDGTLRPIKGVLPIAIQARKEGFKGIILPRENAQEAAIVNNLDVIPVETMQQAIDFFEGRETIAPVRIDTRDIFQHTANQYAADFADVQGQENIKRALEIAAAGGHNVIMIGPPGAGKTMLAKRLPTILPALNMQEALETTKIHSVAGKLGVGTGLLSQRPFRAPHHTISDVALVGGGSNPQPGEISLSHNGVLFLDELPEFKRTVLEVMRQPLEERRVTISRAKVSIDFPANFMLIASMNPCPCGYYNHPEKECVCGPGVVQKYLNKVSGPLLDRIDLHVEVTPVTFDQMTETRKAETSHDIQLRVEKAREVQTRRFADFADIHSNAMMPSQMVKDICQITEAGRNLLKTAMERLGLSARAYDRILKVARTIADLAGTEAIQIQHLAEAIQYRSLDREGWAGVVSIVDNNIKYSLYKSLLKPLLFRLDAERAHHAVFDNLRRAARLPGALAGLRALYDYQHPSLARTVFGLRFANPVGLAAGLDKNAVLTDELATLGFGFVEIGTVTPRPQPGNPLPRLFRLPQDEALINRMGFNNDGAAVVAERLRRRRNRQLLIGGNIGKNKDTPNEHAAADYVAAFEALADVVDYFVVNVSSPNTPGLRELQDKKPLIHLLQQVQARNLARPVPRPLLLKIAPDLTDQQLDDILEIARETQLSGLVATNTTIARPETLRTSAATVAGYGAGGLSGQPLRERATEVIRYLHQRSQGGLPIIGAGGIHSAQDALDKMTAGATLVQLYTGFVYEGPGLVRQINEALAAG